MNDLDARILNAIRRRLVKAEVSAPESLPIKVIAQGASDAIYSLIVGDASAMVARFGATEMGILVRFEVRSKHGRDGILQRVKYASGRSGAFFYDRSLRWQMRNWSGFFPTDDDALDRFGELILGDACKIDMLGSWLPDESRLSYLFPEANICRLVDLEPYFHENPWTVALEGRRVLVIHPFANTIGNQYLNRQRIWPKTDVLPEFNLVTLRAAQTIAGERSGYSSWFDALEEMKSKIDTTEFDVALIGAGAYGFPLAAHVKRLGQRAIHLGGALQVLFGIRGARWENRPEYHGFFNQYWVRPLPEETPRNSKIVEDACYW